MHWLKIDGRPIGQLDASNYYRLELWPGSYTFTIYLPAETFLGQAQHALSTSKQIFLKPGDAGQSFVLEYTDGMTAGSLAFSTLNAEKPVIVGRTLAASLNLRETAKVVTLFKARYDGPSRQGSAHGWGTLTWPDGCAYQGEFEYGEPTTRGRFFFPQGFYFRGRLREGRPFGSGLLFSEKGEIVFAGRFVDEKPHGRGIRLGPNGPEFCVYEHGVDATPPVAQLASEALDRFEAQQIESLLEPVQAVDARILSENERRVQLQKCYLQTVGNNGALRQRLDSQNMLIEALEEIRKESLAQARARQKALAVDFSRTRYDRDLDMRRQVKEQFNQDLAIEREWCRQEINRGRRWCQCAPFADDYLNWADCLPQ
ncbi:MAG: hypothetical protein P8X55_02100 [Desulfosarcinaceae bacterium]